MKIFKSLIFSAFILTGCVTPEEVSDLELRVENLEKVTRLDAYELNKRICLQEGLWCAFAAGSEEGVLECKDLVVMCEKKYSRQFGMGEE